MSIIKKVINKLFPEGTKRRKFIRVIARGIKSINLTNIKKFFKMVKMYGFKYAIFLVGEKLDKTNRPEYELWIRANEPKKFELEAQKKHKFKYEPKISLVVPMYNTPVKYFEELVDSLIRQTYSNWELCLADGSPEKNSKIEKITKKDERIKYKFLGVNKNISGNTNEALKLVTGDFIGLLDHDDMLLDFTLYEVVKAINENPDVDFLFSDEDKIDESVKNRYEPYFKSDYGPDSLGSLNYICHFSVFKKELMDKLGGFRSEYDGAQDYDIILRMTEITQNIVHIPKILYHWRVHKASTAMAPEAKPYAQIAGRKAVTDHLKRIGLEATVREGKLPGTNEVEYKVIGNPKVSIMIPNKDEIETLKVCINSILEKTTYENYEINVIENNSEKESTFKFYEELEKSNPKIHILKYPEKGFNYSKIMNFGARNSNGDFLMQLNNDTELLTPDWLQKMIGYCQRKDVGAVGVALYYPDDTYQHAGTIIGLGGVAGHRFVNMSRTYFNEPTGIRSYFGKESNVENLSACTAACLMTKKSIYEEVGYMNENLAVAFNDVDFCLRIRSKGYLIVYNPYVELKHYESKTRGLEDNPEKQKRFLGEIEEFNKAWKDVMEKGDPYYNINLRLDNCYYKIKQCKADRP